MSKNTTVVPIRLTSKPIRLTSELPNSRFTPYTRYPQRPPPVSSNSLQNKQQNEEENKEENEIIKSYNKYKKNFKGDSKHSSAREFTLKMLKYSNDKYDAQTLSFKQEWHIFLLQKLKPLNDELNDINKEISTPYTADKPNFAILISIVKNYEDYIKIFDINFLIQFVFTIEQQSFTGEFNEKGGVYLKKYYYPVYRILESHLRGREEEEALNTISNTRVLIFLNVILKKKSNTASGIRKRRITKHKQKHKQNSIRRKRRNLKRKTKKKR